ncbi:MAG: hypothetical protein LBK26_00875 [Rickettsiales bacterium]|jgi:hypothetical protein|nr:hypothetical protein [Rickettsiales bacterium]
MQSKNDIEILKEYLDTWALYWVARATFDYIHNTIAGSNVLDFGIDSHGHEITGHINNFHSTLISAEYDAWPNGAPMVSSYKPLPLYMRVVFKNICDQNGLSEKLSDRDKKNIANANIYRRPFIELAAKNYGIEQVLPMIIPSKSRN